MPRLHTRTIPAFTRGPAPTPARPATTRDHVCAFIRAIGHDPGNVTYMEFDARDGLIVETFNRTSGARERDRIRM